MWESEWQDQQNDQDLQVGYSLGMIHEGNARRLLADTHLVQR